MGISGIGYLLLMTVFFPDRRPPFMENMMAMVLLVPLLIPAAIAGGAGSGFHVGVVVCLNLTTSASVLDLRSAGC